MYNPLFGANAGRIPGRARRQDENVSSQSSTTLLPQVIAQASSNDGATDNPDNILEISSLTSTNNFINFCINSAITNGDPSGQQSCNPVPMGHIPERDKIPGTRFSSPRNGDSFFDSANITVTLSTSNFETGNSVNPQLNYLSAPQQLNSNGTVIGHYYLVVDPLESYDQTSPTDPTKPALFSELGTASQNLSLSIKLPVGFYRMTAIPHAANHQPITVPTEQHGSLNDVVYFVVQPDSSTGRKRRSNSQVQVQGFYKNNHLPKYWRTSRQDASTSLTLDPSVIAPNFAQDGVGTSNAVANGYSPSLTSTNNFINYCATLPAIPLTNGTQVFTNSCNSVPMGVLPSSSNLPSVKFTSPPFNDTIKANTPFLISLNVTNFVSGKSTNSEVTFLSAPQQLVQDGRVVGHTSIVIEEYSPDNISNPSEFSLAATIDSQGSSPSGLFTLNMSTGLPIGFYRLSSIISTANHQPVALSTFGHGAIDDAIFFSVTENGGGPPPLPTLLTTTSPAPTITLTNAIETITSTGGTSSTQESTSSKGASNTKNIAGISVGAVVAIALVFMAFISRQRKKRNHNERSPNRLIPFENRQESDRRLMLYNSVSQLQLDALPLSKREGPTNSQVQQTLGLTNIVTSGPTEKIRPPGDLNSSPEAGPSSEQLVGITSPRSSLAPSYHTDYTPTRS